MSNNPRNVENFDLEFGRHAHKCVSHTTQLCDKPKNQKSNFGLHPKCLYVT